MTKEETKEILTEFFEIYGECNEHLDKLIYLVGIGGGLIESVFNLISLHVKTIERLIGDKNGTIDWYLWENNCGSKGLEGGNNDETRPIKTIDDLIWLIYLSVPETDFGDI